MAQGYIYIVATVTADYYQVDPRCIPVWSEPLNCLAFGPCKVPIRRKLEVGDYLFGISPARTRPRRLVFPARISDKVTYREAFQRWPELQGPDGPIHVAPVERPGLPYPESEYELIPGSIHGDRWRRDLASRDLDAFFLCEPAAEVLGRWLGPSGPAVKGGILDFLRGCSVHGHLGLLRGTNVSATERAPIRHGQLCTGLHLETDEPEALLRLCGARTIGAPVERRDASPLRPTTVPSRSTLGGKVRVSNRRASGCSRCI